MAPPKLRPLRTAEEMAKVPRDQPILVELPAIPSGEAIPEDRPVRADAPAPTPATTDDDPVKQLTTQVEELKKAAKYNEEALQRSEKARREALAISEQAAQEAFRAQQNTTATEHEYLSSALVAAQNELAGAKLAAKQAGEAGDFAAQAEAHDRLADARTKINQYEGAIASLEHQIKNAPQEPPKPAPQQPANVNEAIDSNAALLPREREFLKAHPELVIDANLNNELSVAHNRAMRQGIKRGSDQYFAYMDDFLGYKPAAAGNGADQHEDNAMVSAPVSREAPSHSGRTTPDRVTLTAEQREMAHSMGLTDLQYAEQLVRLQQDKINNPEKYARR